METTSDAARMDGLWKEDIRRWKQSKQSDGDADYKLSPRYSFPTMKQLPPVRELVGTYKIIHATGHIINDQMNRSANGTVVIRETENGLLQGAVESKDTGVEMGTFEPSFSFVQTDQQDDSNNTARSIETVLTPDPTLSCHLDEYVCEADILRMRCSVKIISQPVELDWTPEGFAEYGRTEFEVERLARLVERRDYEKSWVFYEKSWIYKHLGLPDACRKIVHDYWQMMLPSPTCSLQKGDLLLHARFLDTAETYLVARREVAD